MRKLVLPIFLTLFPLCAGAQDGVSISQVQIEGDGGANDEFVELYNSADNCANLDGWSLQYKSSSGGFPPAAKKVLSAVELPPHGYYLIANSQYNGAVAADVIHSNFSLSGNSTGATIYLTKNSQAITGVDDSSIVDRFAYGTSASNTPLGAAPLVPSSADKPAPDWAFVRTGFSGDNAVDFALQASNPRNLLGFSGTACGDDSGTPTSSPDSIATTTPESSASSTASNYPTKSQLVKIYRFLPDPAGEDSGNEWVELKNEDSQTILLDGWLLDDKNTGSGPGTDALALSGAVSAGEVKRFVIPASHFALNNTGGDEVNLYFADKSLADSAVYAASAYSDGIFEYIGGLWQPPAQNTGGLGGSSGVGNAQAITYHSPANLKINEVFPNPSGEDPGSEWVEVYNDSSATATLEHFYMGVGESLAWGSGAYELPKILISPNGFVQVVLPKGSVALKNSGKEKVKLFSPAKELLSFTEYADAPENRTWQKTQANTWEWSLPTPGEANIVPGIPRIIFSEILPVPETDQDEFVELYNLATTTINLKDFSLNIGTRSKTFSEADKILPGSYLTLFADDLPVALRNSGQSISLKDSWGREVAAIKYAQAQKGFSYASLDGADFIWTATVTPGAANQMVLGESIKSVPIVKTVSVSPAVKQSAKSAKQPSDEFLLALLQQNKEQSMKLAALQEAVDNLSQEIAAVPLKEAAGTPAASGVFGSRYLVLASVCGILLFGLFKYLPKNPSSGKPV